MQAAAQAGSSQCMHCRLAKFQTILPSCSSSRTCTQVQVLAEKRGGFSDVPVCWVISAGSSFHCLQAPWQLRQPIHRVRSINIPLAIVCLLYFSDAAQERLAFG